MRLSIDFEKIWFMLSTLGEIIYKNVGTRLKDYLWVGYGQKVKSQAICIASRSNIPGHIWYDQVAVHKWSQNN